MIVGQLVNIKFITINRNLSLMGNEHYFYVLLCYLTQQTASMAGCQVPRCLVHIHQGFALHLLLIVPPILPLREGESERER